MKTNDKETIKILLVEDDELAQIACKCYVDKIGCDLDMAETGQEALKLAEQNKYDMIFMDLGILDMDGFTITENIRHMKNHNEKTPIIVLTAHMDKSFEKRAKEVGSNEYVVKPLAPEKLDKLLEKYVKDKIN